MTGAVVPGSVGELLRSATQRLREAGSETARLDAELLLGHVLHIDRATVLAHPEAGVGPQQTDAYRTAVERRAAGESVAYIRGVKEFYGLALAVDRRALIPRPETELLVELGLERLRSLLIEHPRPPGAAPVRVWDVGTGSGAIVVVVAVEARRRGYGRDVTFRATDISADALALAVENAVVHGVADVIEFAQADLLALAGAEPVELVLANLPYIPTAVVPALPPAATFEPTLALDGGPDGLQLIRRLLAQLPAMTTPDASCLLEIGAEQEEPFRLAARELLSGWQLDIHHDLAGQPRVAALSAGAPAG